MHNLKILFVSFGCFLLVSCNGDRPSDIGWSQGKLSACPDKPNCVSSFETDEQHGMTAFSYTGSQADAKLKLIKIVEGQKGTSIVKNEGNYLYVEYMTPLMRYVDDVEFYFVDAEKKLHFRSASRLGHSDMGLNRKRMEEVKAAFE